MTHNFDFDFNDDENLEEPLRPTADLPKLRRMTMEMSLRHQFEFNRVYIAPQLRSLLGHMLNEPEWRGHGIEDFAVREGIMYMSKNNGILSMYFPVCEVKYVLGSLQDLARRAELGREEREFLLSMPRVEVN